MDEVSWTCLPTSGSECSQGGTGAVQDTVAILPGGRLNYTMSGMIPPGAHGSIVSEAMVTAAMDLQDLDATNNHAIDSDAIVPLGFDPPLNSVSASSRLIGRRGTSMGTESSTRWTS